MLRFLTYSVINSDLFADDHRFVINVLMMSTVNLRAVYGCQT